MSNVWNGFSTEVLIDKNIESIYAIRDYLSKTIENEMIPGANILIAKEGKTIMYESFGYQQISPKVLPIDKTMIFDLASLTKIVCTWASILKLVEYGELALDGQVKYYLSLSDDNEFGKSTIEQLLKHTSGLPERTYLKQYGKSEEDIINGICNEPLVYTPNKKVLYSNRGFIILGKIIEIVSKKRLDVFVKDEIWTPLGMDNTFFNPPAHIHNKIAPTEYPNSYGECQRGIVHDENAAWLGGIAGHAGVFSDLNDLSKFCSMVMAGGIYKGKRILNFELLNESLSNKTVGLNENRGYGWLLSGLGNFEGYTCGHTGFTGTGMWLNLKKDMFVILLTNRVHPNRERFLSIKEIREKVLNISCNIL